MSSLSSKMRRRTSGMLSVSGAPPPYDSEFRVYPCLFYYKISAVTKKMHANYTYMERFLLCMAIYMRQQFFTERIRNASPVCTAAYFAALLRDPLKRKDPRPMPLHGLRILNISLCTIISQLRSREFCVGIRLFYRDIPAACTCRRERFPFRPAASFSVPASRCSMRQGPAANTNFLLSLRTRTRKQRPPLSSPR